MLQLPDKVSTIITRLNMGLMGCQAGWLGDSQNRIVEIGLCHQGKNVAWILKAINSNLVMFFHEQREEVRLRATEAHR